MDEGTGTPRQRLEDIRASLQQQNVSYGELAELQDLIPHIEPGDAELLEAAGVPEFPGTDEDEEEPQTYEIVRFYQRPDLERETLATGLTLEEVQAHCEDPETSSKTATSPEAAARTAEFGGWFDGWSAE